MGPGRVHRLSADDIRLQQKQIIDGAVRVCVVTADVVRVYSTVCLCFVCIDL